MAEPRPIPFISTPYDVAHPPALVGTVPQTGVRRCSRDDVSMRVLFGGGYTSDGVGAVLTVAAIRGHDCSLRGWPTVTFTGSHGRPVAAARRLWPFTVPDWLRLHGTSAASTVVRLFGHLCGAADSMQVRLPGDGTVRTYRFDGAHPCTHDAPTFEAMVPAFMSTREGAEFAGRHGLQVSVGGASQSVHPGDVLHFVVTVRSLFEDVPFQPCLGFRSEFYNDATSTVIATEDHMLDCSSMPVLHKDAEIRFAMRAHVPLNVHDGDTLELMGEASAGQPDITGVSFTVVGPPPCNTADVNIRVLAPPEARGSAGSQAAYVNVTAKSGHVCALEGRPSLVFRGARGSPVALATFLGAHPFSNDSSPGPVAYVELSRGVTAQSFVRLVRGPCTDPIAAVDVTLPGQHRATRVAYQGRQPCYRDDTEGLRGTIGPFLRASATA